MAAAVSMNSTSADTEFKRALESLASVGNEVGSILVHAVVRAYVPTCLRAAQYHSSTT
jgi:hypothetical protein